MDHGLRTPFNGETDVSPFMLNHELRSKRYRKIRQKRSRIQTYGLQPISEQRLATPFDILDEDEHAVNMKETSK